MLYIGSHLCNSANTNTFFVCIEFCTIITQYYVAGLTSKLPTSPKKRVGELEILGKPGEGEGVRKPSRGLPTLLYLVVRKTPGNVLFNPDDMTDCRQN